MLFKCLKNFLSYFAKQTSKQTYKRRLQHNLLPLAEVK